MNIFRVTLYILLSGIFCFQANAQLSNGGAPASFSDPTITNSLQRYNISPPDVNKLIAEDEKFTDKYEPLRFAKLIPLDLNPLNCGIWENDQNGNKIWRVKLHLEGSLACGLYFTGFKLPENVELYLYDENQNQVKGVYSSINNRANGLFATSLVYGDGVTLELNVPSDINPGSWFTISEITYAYNHVYGNFESLYENVSDFCEVNVICSPEGDNWQDEKRGVIRIQVKVNGNGYWCTGSLVNNTSLDNTPYVLTADHCAYKFGQYAGPDDLANWIFTFNYESDECENNNYPAELSLTGCSKIAQDGTHGNDGSDFYLVELMDNIPQSYNVYFNGWTLSEDESESGVTIHHPGGDIKKISTYTEQLVTSAWQNNGLPSHWEVYWVETQNNWGVTEGGSSGSPLFNEAGHIVGTLTGGLASCNNPDEPDFYGKFSYHWESNGDIDTNRLKPWLDPINTGALTLAGTEHTNSVQKMKNHSEFNIYPNPVEDVVYVTTSGRIDQPQHFELVDLFGNKIDKQSSTGFEKVIQFETGGLNAGIYFIRHVSGNYTRVKKIIKN